MLKKFNTKFAENVLSYPAIRQTEKGKRKHYLLGGGKKITH